MAGTPASLAPADLTRVRDGRYNTKHNKTFLQEQAQPSMAYCIPQQRAKRASTTPHNKVISTDFTVRFRLLLRHSSPSPRQQDPSTRS